MQRKKLALNGSIDITSAAMCAQEKIGASATDSVWPWSYEFLDRCDSTNLECKRRLSSKAPAFGHVLIATEQTHGRGRGDRSWISPKGNLAFSFLLPQPPIAAQSCQLSLVIGLSLTKTVKHLLEQTQISGHSVAQKWPNDVLINGAKVAGILCEIPAQAKAIIIGVGVNLNSHQDDFPNELKPTLVTLKEIIKKDIDPAAFLRLFFTHFDEDWQNFTTYGLKDIILQIHQNLAYFNKPIKIQDGNQTHEGQLLGISSSGLLRLKTPSGSVQEIITGDVIKP